MKNSKILGTDGVHFTAGGYRLWGSLLADAIISQLDNHTQPSSNQEDIHE